MNLFKKYSASIKEDPDGEQLNKAVVNALVGNELWLDTAKKLEEEYGITRAKPSRGRRISYPNFKQNLSIAAAIAAILLVAVVLRYQPWQPQYQQLANDFIKEDKIVHPLENRSKGQEESLGKWREAAAEAYIDEQYDKAVELGLQIIEQKQEILVSDHFFLGLSFLYLKQYSEAASQFQNAKLRNQLSQTIRFEQEISWYLSLALIQEGALESAKKELRQIVEQNQWKAEQAKQLLDTL